MAIKVVGICGSPIKNGNMELYLQHALEAASAAGAEIELIQLADKTINECRHCNFCLAKQKEGVFCSIQDDMTDLYPKLTAADGLLIGSPAYLGRLTGLTAVFLDRMRVFAFGNRYGGAMRDKIGGALAVAWLRVSGIETTLLSINYAFMAMEMLQAAVHHDGVLFGAGGFSSLEGTGAFDPKDKKQVLKDSKGLKSAKALGERVVELARLIEAGKKALS